ncbi:MAG: hypothetical protein JWP87_3781 [Labilithrix sp.]|nr:hypothetical protein [Labilithrix sp.]
MTGAAPTPYRIELAEHDEGWARIAAREAERLGGAIGPALLEVHHIGSTSIPGIRAKPIVDLLPVVSTLTEVDERRAAVEALGYEWYGDYGIPGRRYCILKDAATGRRVAQLHVFASGSERIAQHVGFRDYLRAHPDEARAYEAEKIAARGLHPDDVNAYNDAKSPWIKGCDARAATWRTTLAND